MTNVYKFDVRVRQSIFLAVAAWLLASPSPLTHAASETECVRPRLQSISREQKLGRKLDPTLSPKHEGYYVDARPSDYEQYTKGHATFTVPPGIKGVTQEDMGVSLLKATPKELNAIVSDGFEHAGELHCVTSAAGAWTRGGGRIKALEPYNIRRFITPSEYDQMLFSNKVTSAKDAQEVMDALGMKAPPKGRVLDEWKNEVIAKHRAIEGGIVRKAAENPEAINPLDVKFTLLALQSKKSGKYISFDVWLSEKTHSEVAGYIGWFKQNFRSKRFSPDPEIDRNIKAALSEYFAESTRRGETHVFGFQRGFKGIEVGTNRIMNETDSLGEGTGMLPFYMKESGRLDQLKSMGKKYLLFDNIEEVNDFSLVLGAHLRNGTEISSVLVPTSPNYKGGAPYKIPMNGKESVALIEKDILSKEMQAQLPPDNNFFFSGSLVMSLETMPKKTVIMEPKSQNGVKFNRLKFMIQDATQTQRAGAIEGRIGFEYENFKYVQEFGENGERYLRNQMSGPIARDARP